MLIRLNKFLTAAEFDSMNDNAMAQGYYRDDRRIFQPGMGWFQPHYYDPSGERQKAGKYMVCKEFGSSFLSIHYWEKWGKVRPPLCIVCPNGEQWEIDRKSSNGTGWIVEGDWPNITCAPSIVVDGYHGFLRGGEFTADLEGRGEHGTKRYKDDPPCQR